MLLGRRRGRLPTRFRARRRSCADWSSGSSARTCGPGARTRCRRRRARHSARRPPVASAAPRDRPSSSAAQVRGFAYGTWLSSKSIPPGSSARAQAAQRLGVLRACAPEAEDAADDDRPVAPRRIEPVQGLDEQRRLEALAARTLPAERDHVGGGVAAVDVDPGLEPGDQEPAGSAAGVEHRLRVLDVPPEVLDLRAVGVEVRPPLGDEPVVPCLRRLHALPCDDLSDGRAGLHDRDDRRARAAGRLVADPARRSGSRRSGSTRGRPAEAGAVVIQEHDESPRGTRSCTSSSAATRPSPSTARSWTRPRGRSSSFATRRRSAARSRPSRGRRCSRSARSPGSRSIPMPWEENADVLPLFGEGRYAEAKALLVEASSVTRPTAALLYNLACAEAQPRRDGRSARASRGGGRGTARSARACARGRATSRRSATTRASPASGRAASGGAGQAVLLDVADVPEARLLERAPRAAVRLLDRGDDRSARRRRRRRARSRRGSAGRARGRSAPPRRSSGRRRRRPSPTWTTSSHSG